MEIDDLASTPFSRRARRAIVVMAVAAVVIPCAGLSYLLATGPANTPTAVLYKNSPSATLEPMEYYFVTPSLGWAIEEPTPMGDFAIFKTTDGAKHWQKQLAISGTLIDYVPPTFQFVDQNHGYVAFGGRLSRLSRTSDGGDHWESVAMPEGNVRVDALVFSTPGNGWLLVGAPADRLYVTSDAGDTWRALPRPPSDADSLSLRSPAEVWMGITAFGSPHTYLSTDGGNTWRQRDLPPPQGRSWDHGLPSRVVLLPGGGVHVFLPPIDAPELIQQGFSITLTSFDQGKSWSHVPTPPGVLGYEDGTHWWAMSATSLFKSSDAGQTWTMTTSGLSDWRFVPHILDSLHAWAVITVANGSGLAFTEDGGLHWTRGTVPTAE